MSSGASSSTGSATSTPDTSVSSFLSTLVPVGLTALVYVLVFLYCRTRQKRVYRPRTYLQTLDEGEKSSDPPQTRFGWVSVWRNIPDEYVLSHQSLDGYLYLRFLKMLTVICFVGCCITWPVLFPVNATGGAGNKQFDLLNFSNVVNKNRYYAHVFVAWIFYGFVMWLITRETIYFINLRHAYLMSPFTASKISSKTVLFTDVPVEYQSIEKLALLFGNSMRRAWLAPDCEKLREKVDERDKDAMKLEGAELKLIKTANKRRLKWIKKNDPRHTQATAAPVATEGAEAAAVQKPADVEAATPGSQYMKEKDRPRHKLGKIPCIGKKVDTINHERSELKRLIPEVENEQLAHKKYEGKLVPAVFVEFVSQQAAQAAFRRMSPKKAPKMNPRCTSAAPNDIIWKNLKLTKNSRLVRLIGKRTFLTLMIIFWSIPVAVVGAISNISYLEKKVPFLSFINHIPAVILGVVTGLLPSIALSILMAMVPVVCRLMAKIGGEVTLSGVELSCQTWYMAFQIVDVFLITTFSSGATTVVPSIINDPSSATSLLAQNLPRASNFYIPYIIVQGMGIAAGILLNIGGLVVFTLVAKFLDTSPRKMYKRYITLSGLGWGTLYPQFGCLGIIALAYGIIAPLLLGFATVGFGLIYLAIRYNSFYVLTNNVDTKGRAYARGLQQLMAGVYLSEVCLIGLFGIKAAAGPIVLTVVLLVATAIYHAVMRHALLPLMVYLPDSLDATEGQHSLFDHGDHKSYDATKAEGVGPSDYSNGASPKMLQKHKITLFDKLFNPRTRSSYSKVRALVPSFPPPSYDEYEAENAYFDPAITSPIPKIWLVRDEMGISQRECAETSLVVPCSDAYAHFNEKGKVVWEFDTAEGDVSEASSLTSMPIYEKRVDY